MKETAINLQGQEYHLLMNGRALFAAQDLFGTAMLAPIIDDISAAGFEKQIRLFCILAEQGELARRYEGYTPDDAAIPTADMVERLIVTATPYDALDIRNALISAFRDGYARETQDDETDVGLAELQKKTTKKSSGRSTSASRAASASRLKKSS